MNNPKWYIRAMNWIIVHLHNDKGGCFELSLPVPPEFNELVDCYVIPNKIHVPNIPAKGTVNGNDKQKPISKSELVGIYKEIDGAKTLRELL